MKISEFDYHLPESLIAQSPLKTRDSSRLLVLDRKNQSLNEIVFSEMINLLKKGDCLCLNNTKVFSARLYGEKETGAKIELLLIKEVSKNIWKTLARPAKRLKTKTKIFFNNKKYSATFLEKFDDGTCLIEFDLGNAQELMDSCGVMPTPPYIKEELKDSDRYQTVYAQKRGAVAAPTAGLHFTDSLLDRLKVKGINICYITLHVGIGTFLSVEAENIEDHIMQSESYEISNEAAKTINDTKSCGGRVFSVGTTATRALESSAVKHENRYIVKEQSQDAEIFIYPGYKFKIVDCLLTNFHLPRSTNLVLVSTFAGIDFVRKAYNKAVDDKFRFYSFGDAMLIV